MASREASVPDYNQTPSTSRFNTLNTSSPHTSIDALRPNPQSSSPNTGAALHGRSHHGIMEETEEELTEDERIEYEKGVISWEKAKNWRFWLRKEWIWYYVIFIVLVVLVGLMAFFHTDVSICQSFV
jgi:hypothetical protein